MNNIKGTELIHKILKLDLFQEHPPVLVDVGASGGLHKIWDILAPYSVCIAFDADSREMDQVNADHRFLKLKIINSILSPFDAEKQKFYLTRSPFCSSLLQSDMQSIQNYSFADLFEEESVEMLNAVTPARVCKNLDLKYIDWYKSDSQGKDLSIFHEFPDSVRSSVLVADFEPGVMDAYQNEDKLHAIMKYMEQKPYWVETLKIHGPERVSFHSLSSVLDHELLGEFKYGASILPSVPGWADIRYFHTTDIKSNKPERDLLLMYVFSLILGQYGFALEVSLVLQKTVQSDLTDEMVEWVVSIMRKSAKKQRLNRELRPRRIAGRIARKLKLKD